MNGISSSQRIFIRPTTRRSMQFKTSFEIYDPRFGELLRDDSTVTCLVSPAVWAEGPVWLAADDAVIFSDVKANRMYRWARSGHVSVFRDHSNYANGNTLDR